MDENKAFRKDEYEFMKNFELRDPVDIVRQLISEDLDFGFEYFFNESTKEEDIRQNEIFLTKYGGLFYPTLGSRIVNSMHSRGSDAWEEKNREIVEKKVLPRLLALPVCRQEQELFRKQIVGGTQGALIPELEEIVVQHATFGRKKKSKTSKRKSR